MKAVARPRAIPNRPGDITSATRCFVASGCPVQIAFRSAEIRQSTAWSVRSGSDTLIVHLGGRMDTLETEIDGRGSSRGPAVIGELWTVPAGLEYRSAMKGESVQFAVIRCSLRQGPAGRLALRAGHWDGGLLNGLRQLQAALRTAGDAGELDASAAEMSVWAAIVRHHSGGRSGTDYRPSDRLSNRQFRLIRDFVHENLGTPIRLAQLSALVDMTTHSFLVAFREAFETSPGQYVITQRLRAASRLLLNTRDDVTTVALRCGFSSHSHLTSTFARRFGITPSGFRERFC